MEGQFLPIVRKYFRAGRSVHQDFIDKLEIRMEVLVYRLLMLHLRLDPSWPHRERWVDYPAWDSWERRASLLKACGELSWGYRSNIAGRTNGVQLEVYLGTYKRKKLVYMLRWREKEGRRYFSNCGGGVSYRRRSCP